MSYFANRPEIVKIFEDLEKFRDYCRFNVDRRGMPLPFNEADLYNKRSWVYLSYLNRGKNNNNRNRGNYNKKRKFN